MKKQFCFLILLMLLGFIYQTSTAQAETVKTEYFPIEAGRFWQYNYIEEDQAMIDINSKDQVDPEDLIIKTKSKLEIEITNVTENEEVIVANVLSHKTYSKPSPEYQDQSRNYCLAIIKSTGYFYDDSPLSKEDFLDEKLTEPKGEPTLVLPLKVGQYWGDIPEIKRSDTWYRWQVEAEEKIKVPAGTFKCFRVAYRSCPDHQIIWFCPKVGIIKQEYEHHGTVSNIYMELTDYGLKK